MQESIRATELIGLLVKMNKQIKYYQVAVAALAVCFLFVSAGCGETRNEATIEPEMVEISLATDTVHTTRSSVDYAGTYKGITPCADCEGIETTLAVNTDSTFSFTTLYMGKGDGKAVVKTGKYVWVDGGTIQLEGITDGPSKFKVGEGRMWQLDMQGNKVEGELADKYILTKIN